MKAYNFNIPFFPLEVSLIPGESCPLRIFEERYKQLIDDSKITNREFIIPFKKDNKLFPLGSEVIIKKIMKLHRNGEMLITVSCKRIVEILDFKNHLPGKLYSGGNIKYLQGNELTSDNDKLRRHIAQLTDEMKYRKFLAMPEINLSQLAISLQMSQDEKYSFNSLLTVEEKERFLLNFLRYKQIIDGQIRAIQNNFHLN